MRCIRRASPRRILGSEQRSRVQNRRDRCAAAVRREPQEIEEWRNSAIGKFCDLVMNRQITKLQISRLLNSLHLVSPKILVVEVLEHFAEVFRGEPLGTVRS